jgi:hypothetical protein
MKKLKNKIKKTAPKLPKIQVTKIIENPDGSANVDFDYDEDFEKVVQESLKLDRKPTEDEVGDFILKCLEEMTDKAEKENNG